MKVHCFIPVFLLYITDTSIQTNERYDIRETIL